MEELIKFVRKQGLVNRFCTIDDIMKKFNLSRRQVLNRVHKSPNLYRLHRSKDKEEREQILVQTKNSLPSQKESYAKSSNNYLKDNYEDCKNSFELIATLFFNLQRKINFNDFTVYYLRYCKTKFNCKLDKKVFFQARKKIYRIFLAEGRDFNK